MKTDILFKDVIAYSQIEQGKKAIEIGIGTGQATKAFLETGCELTAIELGRDLAEYSRLKFQEYKHNAILHLKNLNVQMTLSILHIQLQHFIGFQKK